MTPPLPSKVEVEAVAREITHAIATQRESYKGELHFTYPGHWIPEKLGKEGWLLHLPGLGPKVSFSLFATDSDPKYGNAFDDLKRNAEELVENQGGTIVETKPYSIAGIAGLEYRVSLENGDQILSFLWTYNKGDYQFRVYATSQEHLTLIRPVIAVFVNGFKMAPSVKRSYMQSPAEQAAINLVTCLVYFAALIFCIHLLWFGRLRHWDLWVRIVSSVASLFVAMVPAIIGAAITDSIMTGKRS